MDVPEPRLTAAQRLLLVLLTVYKGFISPLFAGSCRYVPSCSEYARLAVVQHGALRGTWLAVRRLARCHPAASSGFDPVPEPEPRAFHSPHA
jgi:uncharacterized protein